MRESMRDEHRYDESSGRTDYTTIEKSGAEKGTEMKIEFDSRLGRGIAAASYAMSEDVLRPHLSGVCIRVEKGSPVARCIASTGHWLICAESELGSEAKEDADIFLPNSIVRSVLERIEDSVDGTIFDAERIAASSSGGSWEYTWKRSVDTVLPPYDKSIPSWIGNDAPGQRTIHFNTDYFNFARLSLAAYYEHYSTFRRNSIRMQIREALDPIVLTHYSKKIGRYAPSPWMAVIMPISPNSRYDD